MINILAVGHDREMASLIYYALSDKSRYHLAMVELGYTAIEAIGQKQFDVIIIDRDISYMSGLKTAYKLRGALGDNISPFVITAPEFTQSDIEDFLSLGVFDFWEMPVSVQRIKLAVDMIAKEWKGDRDNLKSYREFLERNGK